MITSDQKQRLIAAACAARAQAYAPYSRFTVGAALLTASGALVQGVNVENASYGLTNCAERTAIFTMVTQGEQQAVAMAVCTANGVSPCGACRQVMAEFLPAGAPVYLVDSEGEVRETSLGALLPLRFDQNQLDEGRQKHGL